MSLEASSSGRLMGSTYLLSFLASLLLMQEFLETGKMTEHALRWMLPILLHQKV